MIEHSRQSNAPVNRVDGNAAAGPLGEILRLDTTTALATCRHCSAAATLSDAIVERDAEGVILLCRSCGHTLVTYVSRDGSQYVEFAGAQEPQHADFAFLIQEESEAAATIHAADVSS